MRWRLALALAATAWAAELARWEASGVSRGLALVEGPRAAYDWEGKGAGRVAVLRPLGDYFHRAGFLLRCRSAFPTPLWLVLEHPDRGYGLISVGGRGVTVHSRSNISRLDTRRPRRAVFELGALADGTEIRIEGLDRLRSALLVDSLPPTERPPLVEPALRLARPLQLVTTAGADAPRPEDLPRALGELRELLPLARALGFNGIESYVKWDFVERSPGLFDWSYYDAVAAEIERHGLRWFPLLVVGSAYTLPEWFYRSPENRGFVCLEHRLRNDIQTIFCNHQSSHVKRFLAEFGKRYGGRQVLLGVRLGPSGNYGEAQYPARGGWGWRGRPIHTHIGYWAGDPCARTHFQNWLKQRYGNIGELNRSWQENYNSFDEIEPFLPATAVARRKRLDFADWYVGSMSQWCQQWAEWARAALPGAAIYQSSGGWGPVEIGTDYTHQARAMARLKGGIRLTNESDNFAQNFAITRMASSAARFYGAALGYEPGGFGSARGVVARLFNTITNGADHLFYYHANLYGNDQAIEAWLTHARLLDRRAPPLVEVAAFYPDTTIKLDDEVIRYLWASAFLSRAEAMRSSLDFDYVSEPMIEEGALDRYRVLVFLWGYVTERRVLERIAQWVERGGVLIYPERPRGLLETVEGDNSVARRWQEGRTGQGRVIWFRGDPEPGEPYARFVRDQLRALDVLRPPVRRALAMEKPPWVYWSVLENGMLALLNFGEDAATVRLASGRMLRLPPYAFRLEGSW
ncbi:MAG: beta-galactosidase [Bryobacterales bacterium]|nr:beta-galactosidase [Bryobacteraceae bacterium]MDW8131041.1 beta-galactosidase [Bryobacterales bacterium]